MYVLCRNLFIHNDITINLTELKIYFMCNNVTRYAKTDSGDIE